MSVDWGFESPIFMAKGIVQQAHPLLLKKAVLGVIDHLDNSHETGSSPFEIIDRLVQVILTGEYKPPTPVEEESVMRKVIHLKDGKLTPEDEREIQKFLEQLNGVPEAEQTDDDDLPYEEWLRKMGIPNLDNHRDEKPDDGDEDDKE